MGVKKKADTEEEQFSAHEVSDVILGELEVALESLEEQEQTTRLSSADKNLMSLLQQSISKLASITSLSDLTILLSVVVETLRQLNSVYAPKLMRVLNEVLKYASQLGSKKDIVYSMSGARTAIKRIFAQENMEESHPELDKYQAIPISDPSGTGVGPEVVKIDDDKELKPEQAPKEPEDTSPLMAKVEKAKSMLEKTKNLFRPDDFFVKNPRRKDRVMARLIKDIVRAHKTSELLLKLLNKNPGRRM